MGKESTKKANGRAIIKRIERKAKEAGMSGHELMARVGKANNTLSNWAVRGTIPPADAALAIADELHCSIRWLITEKNDVQEEYNIDEKRLITKYRKIGEQGQKEVKALLFAKPDIGETVTEIVAIKEKKRTAS